MPPGVSATGCPESITTTATRPGQAVGAAPPWSRSTWPARGRDVSDDPDHDYLANTLSLATVGTLVLITIVGVVYAA